VEAHGLNFITAFIAGLVSFASPCVLPLIPAYLCFITGSTLEDLRTGTNDGSRRHLLQHAFAFCLGFSLVFISAGLAIGSAGSALSADRVWLARIGGGVAVVLGLQMLGVFRWTPLMRERRLRLGHSEQRTFWASFLVGIGFAAGWSPCIGPILTGILLLAAREERIQAALLLSAYSLGLALPFMLTAGALGVSLAVIRRLGRYLRWLEIATGSALILVGIALASGGLTRFIGPVTRLIGLS
jgi:cytochrome c-type biogenesis protein